MIFANHFGFYLLPTYAFPFCYTVTRILQYFIIPAAANIFPNMVKKLYFARPRQFIVIADDIFY